MKKLADEHGIALVTALMLTLITLTIVMAVLYSLTQNITTSAAFRRYENSLAGAHGGVELMAKDILPGLLGKGITAAQLLSDYSYLGLTLSSNMCMTQKLTLPTSQWTACNAEEKSPDPKSAPDMTFKLNGLAVGSNIKVYTKLVDSVPGNTEKSHVNLDSAAAVTSASSGVNVPHLPGLYKIEVLGEKETAATERGMLTVLYAY